MDPVSRINVQHLRYLVALVKERHVTRAANSMGIGQPAMSTALSKLRSIFGDPLLVKTTHGMEPTQRAIDLAHRAQDAIDLLSGDPLSSQAFDPATTKTHLSIMASEGIVHQLIPPLMKRLEQEAPNLTLTVVPGDNRRASEFLSNGDVDYMLSFIPSPPHDLYQTMLYRHGIYCIVNKAHPKIQGSISLAQYIAGSHVTWGAYPIPTPTMEKEVDEALLKLGYTRKVAISLASMMASPSIVATSGLLAVLPEKTAFYAARHLPLQVLPLPFDVPTIDVSMLWHERCHRAPIHIWFRKVLKEVAHSI